MNQSAPQPEPLIFACAIIRRGQEVLIVQPPAIAGQPSRWAFPAGPVEGDESPEAACRRACELHLGAAIAIDFGQPPLQGDVNGQPIIYRYFFCHVEGEVQNVDFSDVRWVNIGQLADYEFDSTTQVVVDWLVENFGRGGEAKK